jgi:hypothetical protein
MAKHVNDVPAVNLGRPPFDLSPSSGLEIGKGAHSQLVCDRNGLLSTVF